MSLAGVGWLALRYFGLLRAQVLWREALGTTWEAVAAGLAVCLAIVGAPDVEFGLGAWATIAVCEFLLGSVTGALLSLPGQALLGAAGQSAAMLLHGGSGRGTVRVLVVACLVGGLAADLHHPLLVSLQQHAAVWPVGEPARWWPAAAGLGAQVVGAAHACLGLAFTLATPVLLAVAVLDLTLRLTTRGVATAPGEALRPWLATAAALVALGASWAAYPEAWQRAWG